MKLTLLEIVQDILNDLDSDEVNSISDTLESQQVAQIVKSCFNELTSNRNWPQQRKLIQLDALTDLDKPNYLRAPSNMKELVFFRYECRKPDEEHEDWQDVKYKEPEAFLRYTSSRRGDNVIQVTDFSGSRLYILNDQAPKYWTSFDDKHIVTDAYNKDIEDTLQNYKTQCLAYMSPMWEHTDDAIPDLPDDAFALLVEESKSTASMKLKQVADQKAEQKSARQNRWLSRKSWTVNGGIQYPDYGRKR